MPRERVREKVTIISLAPYSPLYTHHQCGYFEIPAKKPDEPYAKLVVWDNYATRDFGEKRIEPQVVEARDLAEDLIGIYRDDNLTKHGVFIIDTDEPTEEQLAKARTVMEENMRNEVAEADASWARYHDPKKISLHGRAAAEYLGIKREWTIDLRHMVPCKGCQELISPLAIKCPKCGAILDMEKAREMWPEIYGQTATRWVEAPVAEPVKRGPGRPRKEEVV